MNFIAVYSWLVDLGEIALIITAIAGASAVLWKWPLKSIWMRLIRTPLLEQLDEQLEHHLAPMKNDISFIKAEVITNGGSSIKDALKRLEDNQAALKDQINGNTQEIINKQKDKYEQTD